jgi:hypothetical protein
MNVLNWDQPERIMDIEAWKELGFDCGPPGAYRPNMSEEAMQQWKACLVGKTTDHPTVEIRKTTSNQVQVKIVVSLDGVIPGKKYPHRVVADTHGANVRLSMNGTAYLSFVDLLRMNKAILEAMTTLRALRDENKS